LNVQVLLLPLGADWYALELAAVREVVLPGRLEPLPGAPPAALGLMNLRGEVLPVLETATLLGIPQPPRGAGAPHVVVVGCERGAAGLMTSATPQTGVLGDGAGPTELRCGRGRYAVGEDVAVLVDLEALLAPECIGAPA
jgi:purine-binding chemotaxis protein CheW